MTALLCRRRLLLLLPLRQPQPSRPFFFSSIIDFLTGSCGLVSSAAAAVAASPRLPALSNPDSLSKAHSVLSLLRSHHFSPTNIASIVSTVPALLAIHPDVLTPKLCLLSDAAGGPQHLPALVTPNPAVLKTSLDNHLAPVLNLLQTFTTSPDQLRLAVRRGRYLLSCNFRKILRPNINLLLNTGLPVPNISKLITSYPDMITQQADRFADAVSIVQRFGMNPSRALFNHAIRAVSSITPETRERRLNRLRKWGWSEDDISAAFRRAPLILLVSDERMERMVDYLVNTAALRHADIILRPALLMHSLEKCIMPRFAVISVLQKNGLHRGKVVRSTYTCSKSEFFHRFVKKYSDRLPELEDVYRRENDAEELNSEDNERSSEHFPISNDRARPKSP